MYRFGNQVWIDVCVDNTALIHHVWTLLLKLSGEWSFGAIRMFCMARERGSSTFV